MFGFDGDTPDVFAATLKQLDDLEIDVIQASIFTPLPGTPRYAMMKDRLTDGDWSHYDFHHAVFRPKYMSAADLQAGHDWVTHQFYRPWRMVRRMWRHAFRPGGLASLPYLAAVNLAYYGRTFRWKIRGRDPARQPVPATAAPSTAPVSAAV